MAENELPLIITIDPSKANSGATEVIRTLESIKKAAAESGRTMGSGFKQGTSDASSHVKAFYKEQDSISKAHSRALIEDVTRTSSTKSQIEKLSQSRDIATWKENVAAFKLAEKEKADAAKSITAERANIERIQQSRDIATWKENVAAFKLAEKEKAAIAFAQSPQGIFEAAGLKSPQDRIAGINAVKAAQAELRREFIAGEITRKQYNLDMGEAEKKLNLFESGNVRARSALHRMTASLASMTFELTGAIYGLTAIAGILGAPALLGVKFLKTIEDAKMGMTGILLSMGEINHKALTLPQAMSVASGVTKTLADNSIKYATSLEDLVTTFRSILAPGLAAGMNLDQIAKVATIGAIAVKSIGLDSRQVVQEIRDLVAGGIQAASSTLATSLSIKDSDVKKWREAGTLYDELMNRLKGFEMAATERQNTLSGSFDILKLKITRLFSDSSAFEGLKSAVQAISNYIGKINQQTQQIEFNPDLIKNVERYWNVLKAIGSTISWVVEKMVEWSNVTNAIAGAYLANKIFGFAIPLIVLYAEKLRMATLATLGLGAATTTAATTTIAAAETIAVAGGTLAKGGLAARGGLYGVLLWGVYELADFAFHSKWVEDNIFATMMKIGVWWDQTKTKMGFGDSSGQTSVGKIRYPGREKEAATKASDVASGVAAGQAAGKIQEALEKLNDPQRLKQLHDANIKQYENFTKTRLEKTKNDVKLNAEERKKEIALIESEGRRVISAENRRYDQSIIKQEKKDVSPYTKKLAELEAIIEKTKELQEVENKTPKLKTTTQIGLEKSIKQGELIGASPAQIAVLRSRAAIADMEIYTRAVKEFSVINEAALSKISEKQHDITNSVNEYNKTVKDSITEREFELSLAGKTTDEIIALKLLNEQRKIDVATRKEINNILEKYRDLINEIKSNKETTVEQKIDIGSQAESNRDREIAAIEDGGKAQKDVIEKASKQYEGYFGGIKKGWDEYKTTATNSVQQAANVFGNAMKGMEDALVNFVMTGKLNFKSLVQDVLAGLARITVQRAIVGAVSMMGFAQGSAMAGTGIHAYSNSIVNKPTIFPFAQGIGLMGEKAGSPGEAIMPLTRMPSGDLGVQMMGSSSGVNAPVYVNITVDNSGNTTTNVDTTAQDGKRLGKLIGAKVREVMLEESRPGGYLNKG